MLRTRQIQDCVVDSYEEIGSRAAKSAGERGFAQVLDDVIANETPKFAGRNPDIPASTHDFCRAFAGAGHNTPLFLGPNGNLLPTKKQAFFSGCRVLLIRSGGSITIFYEITRSYYD